MSRILIEQIQHNQDKIARIRSNYLKPRKIYPNSTNPPDGFYKLEQAAKFLKADKCITQTTNSFMDEIGISSFSLEKYFTGREIREVTYCLLLPKKECQSCKGDIHPMSYQPLQYKTYIYYTVGNLLNREGYYIEGNIPVLMPYKKRIDSISIEQAYEYLFSPDSNSVTYPYIFITKITKENIRKLLTIIVSNPELYQFIPKNMDFQKEKILP
jgi:hypothetical protein